MKKINLNLNPDQKAELKNLIEREGFNYLDDIANAKNDLSILALSVKETFKIEPVMFKKLVTVNYKQSLEDERLKFDAIDTLYNDIFDNNELKENKNES